MIKKRILLLLNLLLIPSAYALTSESILQTYLDFYGWFDFMAYLLIFIGASKLAIEKAFKKTGEESKSISLLYTGLGLLFSLSLVTWEIKSGFYLFQFGPIVLVLLGLLIIAWIWRLFKSNKEGEKRSVKVSLRYIAIFLLLLIVSIYAIFPAVLYYYYWSNWIKELLAIFIVICVLVIIFSYASSEDKSEGGGGKQGEGWWERRKARKEKERREKEEIASAISAKEREDAKRKAEHQAIRDEQLAEEKRLRDLRIEDEKRARTWRNEDEERKRKQKLKDIEEKKKQEKEDRENAKKAAIEAIGKIKCSIKLSSQLQGKIVDRKDISLNDKVHVESIVTETSGKIKYTWTIQKRKLEASSFAIIAKQFGIGKHSIELKVEDLVTGHTSKDSTTITIKEKTKIEEEIEKENLPKLEVKIMGDIFKKEASGNELIRKGSLQNGSTIDEDEEVIATPTKTSRDYEITWIVSRGSILKNIPFIKSRYVDIKIKGETLRLVPNDFSNPGKKTITLIVKEKSTERKVKDSIKINIKKIKLTDEEKEREEREKQNEEILYKIEDIDKKVDQQKINLERIGEYFAPHTKTDYPAPYSTEKLIEENVEDFQKSMEEKLDDIKKIERIKKEINKKLQFIQLNELIKKEKSLFKNIKDEIKKNRMESYIVAMNRIEDIDKNLNEQKAKLKELDEFISNL